MNRGQHSLKHHATGRRKSIKRTPTKNPLAKPKKITKRNTLRKVIRLGPESRIQTALCEYMFHKYRLIYERHVVKIHNEGSRGKLTTHILKGQGLHPGASDLFISYPCNGYHGLWLEIKREKYKVTKADKEHYDRQVAFIMDQRIAGYWAEMGIGLDECIRIVDEYLKGGK